jgi:hypothetical protein
MSLLYHGLFSGAASGFPRRQGRARLGRVLSARPDLVTALAVFCHRNSRHP